MAPGTTAALLAGYVRAVGVRHIFGYPGESVIAFMEASRQEGVEVVSAVREATAACMAWPPGPRAHAPLSSRPA
jgi:thiamine pyrophosphate-dependent acetolactate synthase large subunit-like protein